MSARLQATFLQAIGQRCYRMRCNRVSALDQWRVEHDRCLTGIEQQQQVTLLIRFFVRIQ